MVQLCGRCTTQKAALRRPKTFEQVSQSVPMFYTRSCLLFSPHHWRLLRSFEAQQTQCLHMYRPLWVLCSYVERAFMRCLKTKYTRQLWPAGCLNVERRLL